MFTVYLAVSAADAQRIGGRGLPLARMSYRLGDDGGLLRAASPPQFQRRDLMVVSNPESRDAGDLDGLSIVSECRKRGGGGILLDFEGEPRLIDQVIGLDALCRREGLELVVPEAYAEFVTHAVLLVSTALTAGSLSRELEKASERYGASRIMLDIERICRDVRLPSPNGESAILSPMEMAGLLSSRRPQTFFSHDLCANYFTYKDAAAATHFVIFDDAVGISRKLQLGRNMGLRGAILMYAEVEMAVQVMGRLRASIKLPLDTPDDEVVRTASNDERVKPYLEGKTIARSIVVKNKLVNLVIK
ncbi:hypothetical protein FACS1894217_06500 [Clostridia bacterium]|nr:hypothetical protein FACS1894217_06500 [Clostridia bacterium]